MSHYRRLPNFEPVNDALDAARQAGINAGDKPYTYEDGDQTIEEIGGYPIPYGEEQVWEMPGIQQITSALGHKSVDAKLKLERLDGEGSVTMHSWVRNYLYGGVPPAITYTEWTDRDGNVVNSKKSHKAVLAESVIQMASDSIRSAYAKPNAIGIYQAKREERQEK